MSAFDTPATRLGPATRLLWRTGASVQLELGSRRVIVDGIDAPVVGELVGRRRATSAAELASTRRLQDQLVGAGFLRPVEDAGPPAQPRLRPELLALSATHGAAAADLLDGRLAARVAFTGAGRIGPHLAAVLAAAGVGAVHLAERRPARLAHATPGGIAAEDEGQPLAEAAERAVLRVAPGADTARPAPGSRLDLTVLAVDEPIDPEVRAALHARGCAHLAVSLAVDHAVIGPLVLPGLTSCLGCADLHRLDRDPAWNALAVQLSAPVRATPTAGVALATMAAGLAALEILAFLDGGQPATIEGTLEVHTRDRRVRRRTWPVHPNCPCLR